jgi:serine/threonine-protein kinase
MIPTTIGRYQVQKELGRGGMAIVYLAHDPTFNREVAIKVLPAELLHDGNFKARFEREAQSVARLDHPAIVSVYDYGEADGQPFLVMRWMAGGSLAERIRGGKPFDLAEAIRIVTVIAPALDEAHAKGMVHRDLKPENILFDARGEPCLADFGIVKLSEAGATLTGTGIVGTPAYMSPEQGRGERDLDGRSDIYALGCIFYEMLSGEPPYLADTPMGQIMKHITAPTPHILARRPELPAAVQTVLDAAMNKRRVNRYPTAAAMVQDLERLLAGQPLPRAEVTPTLTDEPTVAARRSDTPQPALPTPRKRVVPAATPRPAAARGRGRWVWAVLALLLIGLLLGGGFFVTRLPAWQQWVAGPATPSRLALLPPSATRPPATATQAASPTADTPMATDAPSPTVEATATPSAPTSEPAASPTPEPVAAPAPLNYPAGMVDLPDLTQALGADQFSQMIKLATSGQGAFMHMSLSADGSVLALATSTRIYFYNPGDLIPIGEVPLQFPATQIALSPDHRLVAAACQHDTVLWDWQAQQLLFTMTNPLADALNRVNFSNDGQYVVSGGSHTFVWRVADGSLAYTAENIPAQAADISRDGQFLAIPATNQTVQIIRLSDGSLAQELRSFGVTGLHFSPDGEVLASITPEANIVRLWKVSNWQELGVLDGSAVEFSGDGRTVAVDHRKRQTINVWRYGASGAPDVPLGNYAYDRDGTIGIHLSADGTYMAFWYTSQIADDPVGEKFTIKVTRVVDEKPIASLNVSKTWISQVLTSPDELWLYSLSAQSVVQMWDILAAENLASLNRDTATTSPGIGKASNALAASATEITSSNGVMRAQIAGTNVDVFYATDGSKLRTIAANLAATTDIAFTPDGQVLATISQGGTVRIWLVDSGKQVCVIGGVGDVAKLENVQRVFFSSDGATLATYQQDKTLGYWNASTCQLRASYELQPYLLSADKTLFIDWHGDLTFRKIDDGSALFTYLGPFSAPTLSSDGLFFSATLWDKTIHVWGIAP